MKGVMPYSCRFLACKRCLRVTGMPAELVLQWAKQMALAHLLALLDEQESSASE